MPHDQATQPTEPRPIVVLDTSTICDDPEAHLAYPGHAVVIPLTVVSELDGNKHRPDSAGHNARSFLREVERLRTENNGWLNDPVALPGGATLNIAVNGVDKSALKNAGLGMDKGDHRIIGSALGLAVDHPETDVTIVSGDAGLRIKAATLGVNAREHAPVNQKVIDRSGIHVGAFDALWGGKDVVAMSDLDEDDPLSSVLTNEFVLQEGTALAYRRVGDTLVRVNDDYRPRGLKFRGPEQLCALNLLADEDVPLVALRGSTGSGKTTLAIAAGLYAVVDRETHDRLVIVRPVQSVGENLGFLPGDVAEKVAPHYQAVLDVYQALSCDGKHHMSFAEAKNALNVLIEEEVVAFEPITFLRGRTFNNAFVILDEAQNLSKHEIRTAVSRAGSNTKVVATGDDRQIDNPYLSRNTCGLSAMVEAFSGIEEFGQVRFSKGQRSRLADLVEERM